jgi:hypothetical protein
VRARIKKTSLINFLVNKHYLHLYYNFLIMSLVYRHRRLDNNKIFYIGVGSNEKRAYTKRNRSIFWNRIISKSDYCVEIIQNNLSQEDAFELEMFLINIYGRQDNKTGILCNLTDGGEGRSNIVVSLNTRKKLSKAALKTNKKKLTLVNNINSTRHKKVIDTKTGKIYNTIIEASNEANITLRHFKRCLYGDRPNYTGFELIDKKQEYKCKKK